MPEQVTIFSDAMEFMEREIERREMAARQDELLAALGRGEPPPSGKLAEGQFTAPVLAELAASQGVDMPVSNAVAAILAGKITIDAAIDALLTRPFKAEE